MILIEDLNNREIILKKVIISKYYLTSNRDFSKRLMITS